MAKETPKPEVIPLDTQFSTDSFKRNFKLMLREPDERVPRALKEAILDELFSSAKIGVSAKYAHTKRDDFADKQDVINIVKANIGKHPTITAWERSDELKAYKAKYPGRGTLRKWIKEANPKLSNKGGRPKKN
jgi:hypothetical protein